MAKQNTGELINHLGLVRIRVQGDGELEIKAFSYGQNSFEQLSDITLEASTDRIPTVLANFKNQKMQIEVRTRVMDEYYRFQRIIPFIKPTAASYPM